MNHWINTHKELESKCRLQAQTLCLFLDSIANYELRNDAKMDRRRAALFESHLGAENTSPNCSSPTKIHRSHGQFITNFRQLPRPHLGTLRTPNISHLYIKYCVPPLKYCAHRRACTCSPHVPLHALQACLVNP